MRKPTSDLLGSISLLGTSILPHIAKMRWNIQWKIPLTSNNRIGLGTKGRLKQASVFIVSLLACLTIAGCETETEDAFETRQTEKVLGISVNAFPLHQGTQGVDNLPRNRSELRFTLKERKASGKEPPEWYDSRPRVFAQAPDGSTFEALCGHGDEKEIRKGHGFVANLDNRRHHYGTKFNYAFHPDDIYIGPREDGKLGPVLFFRDVGSHSGHPHSMAIDSHGNCHLFVADVHLEEKNRLKLYWVIGDLEKKKWTECWLIDHRAKFTSTSKPWGFAWGDEVHLIWNWQGEERGEICYVRRSKDGFDHKVKMCDSTAKNMDVAIDPDSGTLLVIISEEKGVFVLARPEGGEWTKSTLLGLDFSEDHRVSLASLGKNQFLVSLKRDEFKQYVLTIVNADQKK